MIIGQVCRLKVAPANAVLRAVKQEGFYVPYLFAVVQGKQIRVVPCDDTWVGCEGNSWLQYASRERVRVVGFFEGELPIEEAESC